MSIPLTLTAGISTPAYDPNGFLALDLLDEGNLFDRSRRVAIDQAIDGATIVDDSGYSVADRSATLVFACTWDKAVKVRYLSDNYGILHLSTREGAFAVIPMRVQFTNGEARISLQFVSKLS